MTCMGKMIYDGNNETRTITVTEVNKIKVNVWNEYEE